MEEVVQKVKPRPKEKQVAAYERDEKNRKKVKTSYLNDGVTGQQAVAWLMTFGWSQLKAEALVRQWREEAKPTDYYPELGGRV